MLATAHPPELRTEIPGPRSRELAERLAGVESRNVTCLTPEAPIFWERALGSNIWDVDGNRFLDLGAAFAVANVGHAHPHVARRVAEQVQRLSTNTRYLSELHLDYAEALLARFPDEFDTCFLVNSGSEANEVAMRLATTFTGRQGMAVSEVGYHGITQKALDISHYNALMKVKMNVWNPPLY